MDSPSDNCITCQQLVRPRQEGVQCDGCKRWNHRTCNTGMYQLILNLNNVIVTVFVYNSPWLCLFKLSVSFPCSLFSFYFILSYFPKSHILHSTLKGISCQEYWNAVREETELEWWCSNCFNYDALPVLESTRIDGKFLGCNELDSTQPYCIINYVIFPIRCTAFTSPVFTNPISCFAGQFSSPISSTLRVSTINFSSANFF